MRNRKLVPLMDLSIMKLSNYKLYFFEYLRSYFHSFGPPEPIAIIRIALSIICFSKYNSLINLRMLDHPQVSHLWPLMAIASVIFNIFIFSMLFGYKSRISCFIVALFCFLYRCYNLALFSEIIAL